jgi:hypothetical protein
MSKLKNNNRLKPISLYPLKPEKALFLLMQVKPEEKRKAKKRVALSSA